MTEEDTFRRLQRIPFNELRQRLLPSQGRYLHRDNPERWAESLAKYGWTPEEYLEALYK